MIIVNLKGGLGNQMFQYAAGKRLALTTNTVLKLDTSFLNSVGRQNVTARKFELYDFQITDGIASSEEIRKFKNLKNRVIQKLLPSYSGNPYITEKHFHFDPQVLALTDNHYLEGHWISEKYFNDVAPFLQKVFVPKEIRQCIVTFANRIQNSSSVCIQVRRGDYITNPEVAKLHGVPALDYFHASIESIQQQTENPVFFVFSDDSKWCRDNIKTSAPVCFVEDEINDSNIKSADYLYLMSLCKHFIISNSTFGWWGAWLGAAKNKIVIAPKNWFASSGKKTNDVYPASWKRM